MNHEHRVVNITKLTIQELQPELEKIQRLQDETVKVASRIEDKQKTTKKKDELPWRLTPSAELNQLVNHYLMLSKIRLTCELKLSNLLRILTKF